MRRLLHACICIVFAAAWVGGCGEGGRPVWREFDLTVRGGALPPEQQLIRVRRGDDVLLRWSTDQPVTVHLHGYEIEKDVRPGAPATIWFVAVATGRFPITRHRNGTDIPLGYLEVHPR